MLALGSTALLVTQACLPDLDAFPPPPDAGDTVLSVQSFCGDGVIETLDDGGDAGESCDPGDASTAGCERCRLTCSGTLSEAGHCYFWADPTTSYGAANDACRGARGGAHVVTLGSQDEVDLAASLAGPEADYWIGLSRDDPAGGYVTPLRDEPGWPLAGDSCAGCFAVTGDGGAFEVASPDAGGSASPSCLVAGRNGWTLVPCREGPPRRTLCEREPIGARIYPCGGLLCTTLAVTAEGRRLVKRYVVWPSRATAEEAARTCRTSYDGGALVMFDSREEREQLVRELAERFVGPDDPTLEVWIGLSYAAGAWRWDDDAGRDAPWGAGQPVASEGRAYLLVNDQRFDTQLAQTDEDAGAEVRRVFVCQRPAL